MPSVVHVVVTDHFAGVERYVRDVAVETARRGWECTIVGGLRHQMEASRHEGVSVLPGSSAGQALRSIVRSGRYDVCHVHMTLAEAVGAAARRVHRGALVSTRHFAGPRGSTLAGRAIAPWVGARIDREIAVSDFVARSLERAPDAVLVNGVPASPLLWSAASRVVLVLQRLEPEKDTLTALRAWQASRLWQEGWVMRVVGDGAERANLESWVRHERLEGVTFTGWAESVPAELAAAGLLLAPGSRDSFGLAVVEAMAAGVPMVACGAGGHLETIARVTDAPLFAPGDHVVAAGHLRALLDDGRRAALSAEARALASTRFTVGAHVDRLLEEYACASSASVRVRRTRAVAA